MNQNTQNVDQESVETLADLDVSAEQEKEAKGGAQDFHFTMMMNSSSPDLKS